MLFSDLAARCVVRRLVHFCGALFHFATAPIVTYFMVRLIAAGNLDPLSIVLFTFILFVTICFCCGAGCCRASFCVGLWIGIVATATVTGLAVLNNGEEKHGGPPMPSPVDFRGRAVALLALLLLVLLLRD